MESCFGRVYIIRHNNIQDISVQFPHSFLYLQCNKLKGGTGPLEGLISTNKYTPLACAAVEQFIITATTI